MKTLCTRIKLKPDSLSLVRQWAKEIEQRTEEALATLSEEGVTLELAFLEHTSEGDYLIYLMRANDIRKAMQVFEQSSAPIDLYQKEFIQHTWGEGTRLEKLLELEQSSV